MPEEPTLEDRAARPYVAVSLTTSLSELPVRVPPLWDRVHAWLAAAGKAPAGPPFLRYLVVDMPTRLELEVAVPTTAALPGDGLVRDGTLPAGRYATLLHIGPPEGLVAANAALHRWAEERGIAWQTRPAGNGTAWDARAETYLSDPQAEPDARKHRIEIAYLVADGPAG